jgi:hypothetical protein
LSIQNRLLFEHETSLFEHETPLFEHEIPLFKHETSLFEHETLLFEHELPLFQQDSPLFEHELPLRQSENLFILKQWCLAVNHLYLPHKQKMLFQKMELLANQITQLYLSVR